MLKTTVPAKRESFSQVMNFIESSFDRYKLKKQLKNTYLLVSEELFAKIVSFTKPEDEMSVVISRDISGTCTVRFMFPGTDFELASEDSRDIGLKMLSYYGDNIKFKYQNGMNTATILVGIEYSKLSLYSAIAIGAGLVLALIGSLCFSPEFLYNSMANVLWPIVRMFIKAIQMLSVPVYFFCMLTTISNMFSVIDRYPKSKRLLFSYALSSFIAGAIGVASFYLFSPVIKYGSFYANYADPAASISLKENILNGLAEFVPDNLISPFLEGNTIQLTFVALVMGLALGALGKYSEVIRNAISNLRTLFCKMLSIVYAVTPFIVFIATVEIIFEDGLLVIPYYLLMFSIIIVALLIMAVFYCCVLSISRIKPRDFYKKTKGIMKEVFKIGSTWDAVPQTIRSCEKKFRISKRFLDVSIPLGAANNMDGSCICLAIFTLIIAHLTGVDIGPAEILPVIFSVMILSLATATQPGSLLVSMTVLLPAIGVSTSMLPLVIITEVIFSRLLAAFNVIGDIGISVLIAKDGGNSII